MANQVNTDELFGEDQDWDEALHLIRFEDFEGATNIVDELNYNSGWYNYSTLKFDLKGKRYSIEYKEHTSDNVSDFEFISNTFIELGNVEEMKETITKESLAGIRNHYEKQIKHLEQYREVLSELRTLNKRELKSTGEMLISVGKDAEEKGQTAKIVAIGTFLIEFSKIRNY